jgi:hypothetical protein
VICPVHKFLCDRRLAIEHALGSSAPFVCDLFGDPCYIAALCADRGPWRPTIGYLPRVLAVIEQGITRQKELLLSTQSSGPTSHLIRSDGPRNNILSNSAGLRSSHLVRWQRDWNAKFQLALRALRHELRCGSRARPGCGRSRQC